MCCYNSWHTGTAGTQMMESCQKLTRFVSKEEICCVCVCLCGGGGDSYSEVHVTVLVEKKSEVIH